MRSNSSNSTSSVPPLKASKRLFLVEVYLFILTRLCWYIERKLPYLISDILYGKGDADHLAVRKR